MAIAFISMVFAKHHAKLPRVSTFRFKKELRMSITSFLLLDWPLSIDIFSFTVACLI
jgi:hypothetical protein